MLIYTRKKLNNSKGATITFALLLMLVAIAIGTVVLTAGTAAAGRKSKLADSDTRYYRVLSAADLLRDKISDFTADASVTKTTVIVTTTTVTKSQNELGEDIYTTTTDEQEPVITYSADYKGAALSEYQKNQSIMDDISYAALYGGCSGTSANDIAESAFTGGFRIATKDGAFVFQPGAGSETSFPDMKAYIAYEMDNYGQLSFNVSSGNPDAGGDQLKARVVFKSEVTDGIPEENIDDVTTLSSSGDSFSETTTTTKTETISASVKWVFDRVITNVQEEENPSSGN